jgi:hypothetical protein
MLQNQEKRDVPHSPKISAVVADNVPISMVGMPKDVPPRRGTPEYDESTKKTC